MKLWRGLLIGLVAYVFFLVAVAPADRVLGWMKPLMPGVRVAGVEGTLWSGSAAWASADAIVLESVGWNFRPFMLLTGRAEFSLRGRWNGREMRALGGQPLFGRPYLADLSGRVATADLLAALGVRHFQAAGELDFDVARVQWSDAGIPAVGGAVMWSAAGVSAPLQLDLGKVRMDTEIVDDGLTRGKLVSTEGALLVQADVEMNAQGAYRLDADIRQDGEVPAAVSKFLSTFAEYRDGNYRLEWSDSL